MCPGPADDDENDLLRELEVMMDQNSPEVDQLELGMAKLSVDDKEGGEDNRHFLEQLPPVPAGAIALSPGQRADRTKQQAHPKPLLAT